MRGSWRSIHRFDFFAGCPLGMGSDARPWNSHVFKPFLSKSLSGSATLVRRLVSERIIIVLMLEQGSVLKKIRRVPLG